MRATRALCTLALLTPSLAAQRNSPEEIELLRDTWGTPHIFATTDAGAFYGLGWAAAQDRAFQMYLSLRTMQGRLAETIGNVRHRRRRRDDALANDRKMRTFGFWRAARRVAAELDEESRHLLEAYSAGVNACIAAQRRELITLFAKCELEPEPWTPAACLACWWHLAQFFATDGTRDFIAWRNLSNPRRRRAPQVPPDDATAVVQRADVSAAWIGRVKAFAGEHGIAPAPGPGGEGRKFSHAWVVGGRRSTTGSAVLVSDPQTPVANPSLLYEFHIRGASFDARGVGVAGSPILLIGWNRHVAWGMTALGADQADLFRLHTDAAHPDAYLFDGRWRPMEVRSERIAVRGGRPRELTIRTTHLGPVVSEFAFVGASQAQVALRRVPICDRGRETIQGAIAMLRARDAAMFQRALAGWRFPSANVVFGDRQGHIGFAAVGAIPIRSRHAPAGGRAAQDGSAARFSWRGCVPFQLMPQVIDPAAGVLFSANHRAIGSFYPIPLGNMTGSRGDTLRSWRLRELLGARERFTPREVLAIHSDATNPARRDIVRLGLHLRDVQGVVLEPDAGAALVRLEPWLRAGASSDLRQGGAALAMQMNLSFRFTATELTGLHGGGESGLCRFLQAARRRLGADPQAPLEPIEREWIERVLSSAWRAAVERYGPDPSVWEERARAAVRSRRLGWFESLDGFPSLDPRNDLAFPALTCIDGATIHSQASQAYTQWVPLHDVDRALAILPVGASERPSDPARLSTIELWGRGELHPAPLSRRALEKLRRSSRILHVVTHR